MCYINISIIIQKLLESNKFIINTKIISVKTFTFNYGK